MMQKSAVWNDFGFKQFAENCAPHLFSPVYSSAALPIYLNDYFYQHQAQLCNYSADKNVPAFDEAIPNSVPYSLNVLDIYSFSTKVIQLSSDSKSETVMNSISWEEW